MRSWDPRAHTGCHSATMCKAGHPPPFHLGIACTWNVEGVRRICHFTDLLSPRPEGLRTLAHQVLSVQVRDMRQGRDTGSQKGACFQSRDASITPESGAVFTGVESAEPSTIQTPKVRPTFSEGTQQRPVCLCIASEGGDRFTLQGKKRMLGLKSPDSKPPFKASPRLSRVSLCWL